MSLIAVCSFSPSRDLVIAVSLVLPLRPLLLDLWGAGQRVCAPKYPRKTLVLALTTSRGFKCHTRPFHESPCH